MYTGLPYFKGYDRFTTTLIERPSRVLQPTFSIIVRFFLNSLTVTSDSHHGSYPLVFDEPRYKNIKKFRFVSERFCLCKYCQFGHYHNQNRLETFAFDLRESRRVSIPFGSTVEDTGYRPWT